MKPGKVASRSKIHDGVKFLFYAHTLCTNYETKKFLLVNFSVRNKRRLCSVHGQNLKSELKKKQQKRFIGHHNHFSLLTMITFK